MADVNFIGSMSFSSSNQDLANAFAFDLFSFPICEPVPSILPLDAKVPAVHSVAS